MRMNARPSRLSAVVPVILASISACSGNEITSGVLPIGDVPAGAGGRAQSSTLGADGTSGTGGASLGRGGASAPADAREGGGGGGGSGNGNSGGGRTAGASAGDDGKSGRGGANAAGSGPGTAGASGTAGTKGVGGAAGTGGTRGTAGASGTAGTKGIGGAAGTGGTRGTAGASGTAGTKGVGGAAGTGGTRGTAGASGSGSTCGTAAEGASVTLTCPQGQIIDSVTFASYGTPSGTCGSLAVGTCNAASSATTVQSQCVGRARCTVAASNDTFTDPCRSTTKKLAVEVSCAPGESNVARTPYKGVANSPAAQISALGATWCYNWGTKPAATDCNDPYFVPMVWGPGDVAGAIKAIGNAGYTTVLGFNEPNKSDQANMSVDSAIALWPQMTSDPNIRVSSPAVSDDGRAWLEDFMTKAQAQGLRVDFIAMHWYGWNAGSCVASQLEGAVKWASKWNRPIWITEFGCMGSSNPDEKTVLNFFHTAIPMLDSHPLVERYAWYPWNTYNHLYESNAITALGEAFAAAPPYRE